MNPQQRAVEQPLNHETFVLEDKLQVSLRLQVKRRLETGGQEILEDLVAVKSNQLKDPIGIETRKTNNTVVFWGSCAYRRSSIYHLTGRDLFKLKGRTQIYETFGAAM